MTYTRPLRRMMRHLAQRLRMEGDTFMNSFLLAGTAKSLIILVLFKIVYTFGHLLWSQDSQDERVSFGHSDRMFEMRRQ